MHKEPGISGYKGLSLVRILALGMQVWDLNSWIQCHLCVLLESMRSQYERSRWYPSLVLSSDLDA